MDWSNILTKALPYVKTNGINLIAAILIYIIGKWVVRIITNMMRKMLNKSKMDQTLVTFLANIVYAILLIFVIIAAIGKLGVQTTSLVAIIGAAGLAVGLALQGSLSNFASGVMLILFRPFKVGDVVIAAGTEGKVEEVGIFNTVILTSDNKKVIIPNTPIAGGAITNFSAMPTRRIELSVAVPANSEIAKVRQLLQSIIDADERILKDPAPAIVIEDANPDGIKFGIYPHVKNADMGAVQASLTETIKLKLTEQGIWS